MNATQQHALGLWDIARICTKIGATAFGGWPTSAVMLEDELVNKRGVLSAKRMHAAVAYAQILPGGTQVCIMANVGYQLRGLPGAFTATVGFLLPGISMIVAFAITYFHLAQHTQIMSHAGGLIAALSGIIFANGLKLGAQRITNPKLWILVVAAFGAKVWLHVDTLLLISAFAIGGLLISMQTKQLHTEKQND